MGMEHAPDALQNFRNPVMSTGAAPVSAIAVRAPRTMLGFADFLVGTAVEICAACLVAAEIVVLFVGVISRYVFHSPIIWSDELASLLFLWLAMLGSVVAFRNASHMRMTALVSKTSAHVQPFFEMFALAASIAFLLLTIGPALAQTPPPTAHSLPESRPPAAPADRENPAPDTIERGG